MCLAALAGDLRQSLLSEEGERKEEEKVGEGLAERFEAAESEHSNSVRPRRSS